jgi:predicted nucleic acid-binding protein
MIYIDTSCLLKLFFNEPSSDSVRSAVEVEDQIVISSLTELETLIQLKASWKGGDVSRSQWRKLEAELALLRNERPFEFRALPGSLFNTALRQHRNSGEVHSRAVDRLHLAAMEDLEISRLMTHDNAQAAAALELGFSVLKPGKT